MQDPFRSPTSPVKPAAPEKPAGEYFDNPYQPATSGSLPIESQSAERTWATFTHLSPLLNFVVTLPFVNILAPLIIWFVKRDTMPFVADQAREAVNFQITLAIAGVLCVPLFFLFGLGLVLGIALFVYSIVCMVLAAKAANEGKAYRYPLTIRLF